MRNPDYTDEAYRAWVAELLEFFRNWPYTTDEGVLFADPPFRPTRKDEASLPERWRVED